VKDFPVPTNVKATRGFLGLCSYYRRYIKDFATIASPLTDLTKKKQYFEWSEQCQKSFELLRQKFTSTEILAFPQFHSDKPLILYTDASKISIGYLLAQEQLIEINGKTVIRERPIIFGGQRMSKAQEHYSVTEM